MKFTPEVVAAFEVLHAAAETDFERHRLDVLEQDLHEPPAPEIIDETHQKFNGVVYKKNSGGHFSNDIRIHQAVWSYFNGEIPEEYHIHHIDEDKTNNNAENLLCLSKSEHQAIHMQNGGYHEQRKCLLVCKQCGEKYVGYKSGNNRFCSEECRKAFYTVTRICEVCGKSFETQTPSSKFCSHECMGKARQKIKVCEECGKEFNGRAKQKYCSFACYLRHNKKQPHQNYHEERTCIICGKTFSVYKYDKSQTCSPTCSAKLSWQHRKSK